MKNLIHDLSKGNKFNCLDIGAVCNLSENVISLTNFRQMYTFCTSPSFKTIDYISEYKSVWKE